MKLAEKMAIVAAGIAGFAGVSYVYAEERRRRILEAEREARRQRFHYGDEADVPTTEPEGPVIFEQFGSNGESCWCFGDDAFAAPDAEPETEAEELSEEPECEPEAGWDTASAGSPDVSYAAHHMPPTKMVDERELVKTALLLGVVRAQNLFAQMDNFSKNVLYSPISLEFALALLSSGAHGETLAQILSYTDMLTSDKVRDYMESVSGLSDEDGKVRVANSLWANSSMAFYSKFVQDAKDFYDAHVESTSFHDVAALCEKVNSWCDEKTNGLIPQVLTPDIVDAAASFILCNSLYFESAWWKAWDVREGGEFLCSDSFVETDIPMLHSVVGSYYETVNAKAFGKKYRNGFKFIGILPNSGARIEDIDLVELLNSETHEFDVEVEMPKLDIEYTSTQLKDILQSLGVVDIFSSELANFGGMMPRRGDCVSDIIQKCKLELDENGTKAAAVTTAAIRFASVPQSKEKRDVYLNRPFYYMILDEERGRVMFIGSVNSVRGGRGNDQRS